MSAPQQTRSRDRRPSPGAVLAAVGFSVFVAADDLTVVSTMLRPIIGDLGLVLPDGLNDAAWVVNAYLIAFVAIMPIAGRVSDVVGRRRTFLFAYLAFLAGTTLIPLSVSLDSPFRWFLIGRILTALGGGAMVPVALAVVGDVFPERRRSRALGQLGAIETLGWVWGPLYGAVLVRFLSWQWQFWLNIPLGLVGLALVWWALADLDEPNRNISIDWIGAGLLTATLVALSVALLNGAKIQSVTGLDELTGGTRSTVWLYPVAAVGALLFVWWERRARQPLISPDLLRGRNLVIALVINFVVGAGLVIAMVDVPLYINAIELDLERAAVVSGWILSALTASMAVASYVGGRITERTWYRPPILAGAALATAAYAWMGATWSSSTSLPMFALQLALLGAGFGLTVAPTTGAVVDAAPPDQRGAAAGLVMLVRLLGFSVGLAALTSWALHRFNTLRSTVVLPDTNIEEAIIAAQERLTATAIAETFSAAAAVVAVGFIVGIAMRRRAGRDASTDRQLVGDHRVASDTVAEVDQAQTAGLPIEITPTDETAGVPAGTTAVVPADHRAPHTLEDDMSNDDAQRNEHPNSVEVDTAEVEASGGDAGVDGARVPALATVDRAATLSDVEMLRRQMHMMVGVLGLLLLGAIGIIVALILRVNAANAEATAARADAARVEAGAAVYSSQIQGFQDQITELAPQVNEQVTAAITGLRSFGTSELEFPVKVDQTVKLDTSVDIKRTVEIPIDFSVPIKQSFDTTISVSTPLGAIPVDVTVPVNVDVPIKQTLSIPIDESVPVDQDIPIKLDLPVQIDVGTTELSTLTESIAVGLESLQSILNGLGAQTG